MNKIQEYAAKKKAADGGMVDATPETQADLQVLKSVMLYNAKRPSGLQNASVATISRAP